MQFNGLDLGVFIGYLLIMVGLGIYLSTRGSKKDGTQDYFLASKSLPWWAVGGSLIASNISAEQFIGMSGSGYVMGMAIAAYELMAALTLIVVAKFLLPVFLKKGIYTMPQFLEERFDKNVRTGLAIFWVLLFVFVNITSVLYLGGLALQSILGVPMMLGIAGLAIYAATFSIFGGLKAVVWTDVVQVVVLLFGGFLASYMVLSEFGGGFFSGLEALYTQAPDKFNMILEKGHPSYNDLPGISILVGGMWIANMYYWGTNQYIIQRALAAKNLKEAQKGTAFAAIMKLVLPVIVVVPGIAAFVLKAPLDVPDEAYPWVLNNYVTTGFKGLAFAALIAAIGSSLSSMVNSASTIFTLDIYRPFFMKGRAQTADMDAREEDAKDLKDQQEVHLVRIGKIVSAAALILGVIVAPLLGGIDQAFQFIQEYTGFISPGVVAIFLFGMFWKRTSTAAALTAVIISIPLSMGFKFGLPDLPFIDRMGLCFLLISLVIIVVSVLTNKGADRKAILIPAGLFKTAPVFNISALFVLGVLAVVYGLFG